MATALDLDHERCRLKVCVLCYRKGSRKLSATDIAAINEFVIDGYDVNNPDFPASLCNGCYLLLSKRRNGHDIDLPCFDDYDPQRPRDLRSEVSCSCKICKIAKVDKREATKLKKKPGRPSSSDTDGPSSTLRRNIKICSQCFTIIHRGCVHNSNSCASLKNKVKNASDLLGSSSPTVVRLHRKLEKEERHKNDNSSTTSKFKISSENMSVIQQDLNLSTRETLVLASDIRKASQSRQIIEPCLKEKLYEKHHSLDDFFTLCSDATFFLTSASQEKVTKPVVYCNDLIALIDHIKCHRDLDDDCLVRIGIDGGGGFIKVCLSIFNESNVHSDQRLSKSFSDAGVKKAFIIGIVPEIPENYWNILKLWTTVGVNRMDMPFTIATDMKLCNILTGLMAHGSLHPCTWCNVDKYHLKEDGEKRTFGDLKSKFWSFYNSGEEKIKAKAYGNVIHPSIIKGDIDMVRVIEVIPPPELHLMIGAFCTIYNCMKIAWPDVDMWLERCHVSKEQRHGGTFTGNVTRTLLKNIDALQAMCPLKCLPFVKVLRCLNEVVVSCFSWDLSQGYRAKILQFMKSYLEIDDLPVTPKVHAIFFHVAELCEMRGCGLAAFSEQTSESIHHDFLSLWECYKTRSTEHPDYGKRLLNAVQRYNSQHV